jgi:hypothetical protein
MSSKTKREKERRNRTHGPLRNRDPSLYVGRVKIPVGAIPANSDEQAPNNSYSPPVYYEDRDVECIDCGTVESWTAEQQHWWYEIAKGSVDSGAVRCRACRKLRRSERDHQRERSEHGRPDKERRQSVTQRSVEPDAE